MKKDSLKIHSLCVAFAVALSFPFAATTHAQAVIPGVTGPTFNLTAGPAHIPTPDGDSVLIWAYGNSGSNVQYPGPTLIVKEGQTVTINLTNNLSKPTSIVFPGHGIVTDPAAPSGTPGLLTREAAAGGGTVSYKFKATHPGTYMYHSGTNTELQVEMGLLGAIIVRPASFNQSTNRTAYGHSDTAYDHEYLFLLTEMDVVFHDLVDFGFAEFVDNTTYFPYLWFINGRNGLDTLQPNGAPWAPNQPYSALARTHPGEKILLRMIGGGRDTHPFHHHGNHSIIIARDGRMISTNPGGGAAGPGPDLRTADFTYNILPGGTYDTIFDWTGHKLGWDIYGDPTDPTVAENFGHTCNDTSENRPGSSEAEFDPTGMCAGDCMGDIGTMTAWEYCPDHGKPMPVVLPGLQDLTFGGLYTGNAFLGSFGALPPGEGGLNLNGGLTFIWHSHTEKELINNDIFPGGMLTFVIIEPPGVPIP